MVTEVGALAVKLQTLRNEEITWPNIVITGSPIHNYSKLSSDQGTMLPTKARSATTRPGTRCMPCGSKRPRAPTVFDSAQNRSSTSALSDFCVEHELFVHIDSPQQLVPILSALHGEIQDGFNTHGVQILSPHYTNQPDQAVVIPQHRWHAPPARPEH